MYTFQSDLSACSLLIGRAYAEAGSSVKHEEQIKEEEKDVAEEVESDDALESSSGGEEDEAGSEGKRKKQRVGFRDRKVINSQHSHHLNRIMMRSGSSSRYLMHSSGFTVCRQNVNSSHLISMQIHSHEIKLHISELGFNLMCVISGNVAERQ